MVREIEFEFREDVSGSGQFLASGNVVRNIRQYINSGEVDAAARLYANCIESVGDELLDDIRAGASKKATELAAEMFFRARDYRRAAECAERAGNFAQAAQFFEADYNLEHAAALYLKANNLAKAAELFEKSLSFNKAGDLYYRVSDSLKAAECWERGGNYLNAGKLYLKMSRWDKAVEVLQKIEALDTAFASASWLLGNVYERSGKPEIAARHYIRVAKNRPVDATTIEIFYRLAQIYQQRNLHEPARKVLQKVAAFDPQFKDVAVRLRGLENATEAAPQAVDEGLEEEEAPQRMISIDPDFEFLKGLRLFRELSLDELKVVHTEAERVQFKTGDYLIHQGMPGEALFIIIRGKIRISTRDAGGQEVVLVELGPGAHVGEMSLIDDAPTSADVRAMEDVRAFRISRTRFRDILSTHERIALRVYRTFVDELVERLRETNRKLQEKSN